MQGKWLVDSEVFIQRLCIFVIKPQQQVNMMIKLIFFTFYKCIFFEQFCLSSAAKKQNTSRHRIIPCAVELNFYSSKYFKSISIGTNLKFMVTQIFWNISTIIGKKSRLYGVSGHSRTIKLSIKGYWVKYKHKQLNSWKSTDVNIY